VLVKTDKINFKPVLLVFAVWHQAVGVVSESPVSPSKRCRKLFVPRDLSRQSMLETTETNKKEMSHKYFYYEQTFHERF